MATPINANHRNLPVRQKQHAQRGHKLHQHRCEGGCVSVSMCVVFGRPTCISVSWTLTANLLLKATLGCRGEVRCGRKLSASADLWLAPGSMPATSKLVCRSAFSRR